METIRNEFMATLVPDATHLETSELALLETAREVMSKAYAPYSEFRVGAALRLADGTIITGNNQENAAFPSGLCAERVAFFSAGAMYPGAVITDVAIVASSERFEVDHPITPCGACRQVMLEYELNQDVEIRLLFSGNTGKIVRMEGIRNLLPLFFRESSLRK
jgi:cytidine deaminase